ncbi:UDP-GalNAc:beta-1:3-N-acetylgalactosaminyltransferase 2-like protein [Leptotrombidium deliense]|uniref:Hexosyltransferase n=1 Tax=Leptotrombidium deliense TaxID=299467 RepID=A0A443SLM9_9ACAR|nr:UDP-GalNAc:beta-1:3-N-acetylgalactosaminyltransferase 2-like protein [Leptotrombidium deliense]
MLKEVVEETTITVNSTKENGYLYAQLKPAIKLPRYFVGIIVVNGTDTDNCKSKTEWNVLTGLVKYLRIYPEYDLPLSKPFNKYSIVAPTIVFRAADKVALRTFSHFYHNQSLEFEALLNKKNLKLQNELSLHSDLLLIDTVETYQNLPEKVVHSMSLTTGKFVFRYFLKTDDDCFLNIPLILQNLNKFERKTKFWWGNFRTNWAVNLYGKWAEPDFESPSYPPFACGSGNVLSRDLIDWIVMNKNYLHKFQGEDVSLGIWLSACLPKYIQVHIFLVAAIVLNDYFTG